MASVVRIQFPSKQLVRAIVACTVVAFVSPMRGDDAEAPHAKSDGKGIRGAGYTYAKEFYPRLMKNPSSTEFDWESVETAHLYNIRDKEADELVSVYEVNGVLRSRNSFNALVPSRWTMIVVERETQSEMAIAMLDGKVVGQSDFGGRLLDVAKKQRQEMQARRDAETRERAAAAKKTRDGEKAFLAGNELGKTHAKKIGAAARRIDVAELTRRAKKLADQNEYTDEFLIEQFTAGYVAAMKAE